MKLSILDQSPISTNQSAQDALYESMKLARIGEKLGYTRYWIAEHHDLSGLACPAPEVMLGFIGANTKFIRIGSGATLLPHYKPFKVAETYNMLATLFPGRIDLGIGRAPGGSAEATNALNDNFLQKVYKMPEAVKELLGFLNNDFPSNHPFAKVNASPMPEVPPVTWILGTSRKSTHLASEYGLPYAFGQFMSDDNGVDIINDYINSFQPTSQSNYPYAMVTLSVICAETTEAAEEITLSSLIWSIQKEKGEGKQGVPSIQEAKEYPLTEEELNSINKLKRKMVIGNPKEVKRKLQKLQLDYQVNEFMLVTITHSPQDRINSYKLLAAEILNKK